MKRISSALLQFSPKSNDLGKGKELRDGLSVVVQIGETLWVANDELISLERLSLSKDHSNGTYEYGNHRQFALDEYLRLPVPPSSNSEKIEEADIEGLDYKDGYIWLVGSHSQVRKKPYKEYTAGDNIKRLANVKSEGNRFLLARIPMDEKNYTLERKVVSLTKNRTAAQLHGERDGNDLTITLEKDEHLGKFLSIPGKDNGLDIEGLAVADERIYLGLRGPVLRGFAVILELQVKEDDVSILKLKNIGSQDRPYRKHYLQLDGLGIRDLCVQGDDLLILAGPTMDLDGPVVIYRWEGGAQSNEEGLIFEDSLKMVMEVPFGQREEHAEGITLFSLDGVDARSILVVYDSASQQRKKGQTCVEADIFALP